MFFLNMAEHKFITVSNTVVAPCTLACLGVKTLHTFFYAGSENIIIIQDAKEKLMAAPSRELIGYFTSSL